MEVGGPLLGADPAEEDGADAVDCSALDIFALEARSGMDRGDV